MDILDGTDQRCPDHQGVLIFQVVLYDEVSFRTSTKCLGIVSTLKNFTVTLLY